MNNNGNASSHSAYYRINFGDIIRDITRPHDYIPKAPQEYINNIVREQHIAIESGVLENNPDIVINNLCSTILSRIPLNHSSIPYGRQSKFININQDDHRTPRDKLWNAFQEMELFGQLREAGYQYHYDKTLDPIRRHKNNENLVNKYDDLVTLVCIARSWLIDDGTTLVSDFINDYLEAFSELKDDYSAKLIIAKTMFDVLYTFGNSHDPSIDMDFIDSFVTHLKYNNIHLGNAYYEALDIFIENGVLRDHHTYRMLIEKGMSLDLIAGQSILNKLKVARFQVRNNKANLVLPVIANFTLFVKNNIPKKNATPMTDDVKQFIIKEFESVIMRPLGESLRSALNQRLLRDLLDFISCSSPDMLSFVLDNFVNCFIETLRCMFINSAYVVFDNTSEEYSNNLNTLLGFSDIAFSNAPQLGIFCKKCIGELYEFKINVPMSVNVDNIYALRALAPHHAFVCEQYIRDQAIMKSLRAKVNFIARNKNQRGIDKKGKIYIKHDPVHLNLASLAGKIAEY